MKRTQLKQANQRRPLHRGAFQMVCFGQDRSFEFAHHKTRCDIASLVQRARRVKKICLWHIFSQSVEQALLARGPEGGPKGRRDCCALHYFSASGQQKSPRTGGLQAVIGRVSGFFIPACCRIRGRIWHCGGFYCRIRSRIWYPRRGRPAGERAAGIAGGQAAGTGAAGAAYSSSGRPA